MRVTSSGEPIVSRRQFTSSGCSADTFLTRMRRCFNRSKVAAASAKRAFEGMKARRVLVKHIAGLHPLLANCLRLTVGTPDENTLMIDALKASL